MAEDNEKQRELRKKEKLERDLKQAKDENDNHVLETSNLRNTTETLKADLAKQTQQFRENKASFIGDESFLTLDSSCLWAVYWNIEVNEVIFKF